MSSDFLLCLDFDGVICDSIRECLASSWIAYHRLVKNDPPDRVPIRLQADFAVLRPLIRSGEDYVLIQEILDRGWEVREQADFDRLLASAGNGTMERYKELFYRARGDLLDRHRAYWLSLNRVYPHMREPLRGLASHDRLHIVSTKRSDFIVSILAADGIELNPERVHYSSARGKPGLLSEILDAAGVERAVFVDDQIDHLTGGGWRDGVERLLAAWGYVKPEWLGGGTGINVIDPDGMGRLFERFRGCGG